MDPLPHISHSLAPGYQTICYLPRLKVSVALRYVRTFPWVPEAWGRSGCMFRGSSLRNSAFARPGGSIERADPVIDRRTFFAGTGVMLLATPLAASPDTSIYVELRT